MIPFQTKFSKNLLSFLKNKLQYDKQRRQERCMLKVQTIPMQLCAKFPIKIRLLISLDHKQIIR